MKTPNNLYEQDFYLWTQITAEQLKENKFNEIDKINRKKQKIKKKYFSLRE